MLVAKTVTYSESQRRKSRVRHCVTCGVYVLGSQEESGGGRVGERVPSDGIAYGRVAAVQILETDLIFLSIRHAATREPDSRPCSIALPT